MDIFDNLRKSSRENVEVRKQAIERLDKKIEQDEMAEMAKIKLASALDMAECCKRISQLPDVTKAYPVIDLYSRSADKKDAFLIYNAARHQTKPDNIKKQKAILDDESLSVYLDPKIVVEKGKDVNFVLNESGSYHLPLVDGEREKYAKNPELLLTPREDFCFCPFEFNYQTMSASTQISTCREFGKSGGMSDVEGVVNGMLEENYLAISQGKTNDTKNAGGGSSGDSTKKSHHIDFDKQGVRQHTRFATRQQGHVEI